MRNIFAVMVVIGLLMLAFSAYRVSNELPLFVPIVTPTPKPVVKIHLRILTDEHQVVLDNINKYRVSQGKAEVKAESEACDIAEDRSFTVSKIWIQPNPSQPQMHQGFLDYKLPYDGQWFENLSRGYSAYNVVDAWIASPEHRDNLLADMKYVCVENTGVFWVMIGWQPDNSKVIYQED